MPLEIIKAEDAEEVKKSTPHLALTSLPLQGGSANKRNVSLLMKSDVQLTEEVKKALKALGYSEDINKAFYSQIRSSLSTLLQEAYGDEDSYVWVEDFDETQAIFSTCEGLFSVGYSNKDGQITLSSDLATPVDRVVSYSPVDGKLLLSEEAEDKLEDGTYALVAKALENEETQNRLAKLFKSKLEENTLNEQIQKAVEEVTTLLKSQLEESTKALEKANARIADLEKAAVQKLRKEALNAVEKSAEKVEELLKSLESASDEVFQAVVKALGEKAQLVEQSDVFKQVSVVTKEEIEAGEDPLTKMLKAQYGSK